MSWSDIFVALGAAAVVFGGFLAWPPAGWVLLGCALFGFSVELGRREQERRGAADR